jgi:Raf kinase inhibitor-like YbhB/YbcL family protein
MMQALLRPLGRALRKRRAGAHLRVAEDPRFAHVPRTIVVTSDGFADGEPLPPGLESPPLQWTEIPDGTVTLAIVVEDVDVPLPRPATHAVAYAIEPSVHGLGTGDMKPDRVTMGKNSGRMRAFAGATPIPGHGPHRYIFTVLALDYAPNFDQAPSRSRLLDAAAGHVIALGELTGTREA